MTTKTWKTWTSKELTKLDELRTDGATIASIAATLGRSFASVKCQVQQQGLTRGQRRINWFDILITGHTIKGAGMQAGTTIWAVKQAKRRLRRAGFDIPDALPS